MERRKCKLCTRTFSNGRALGGHMKAHLATIHQHLDGADSASSSFSFSGEEDDEHQEIKSFVVEDKSFVFYGLRENPKKNVKLSDPEFSSAVAGDGAARDGVVQDRESETESSKNPTRRRSKRTRKPGFLGVQKRSFKFKKSSSSESLSPSSSPPETVDPEPVSSVSDTCSDEDVAMCLVMLSRDAWIRNNSNEDQDQEIVSIRERSPEKKINGGKFRCEKCKKLFRSSQALISHKKICSLNRTELRNNEKIFECPYCFKVFGSGQALGGHKRSHLVGSSTGNDSTAVSSAAAGSEVLVKRENKLIDLNLPAPLDDDDFSVICDA